MEGKTVFLPYVQRILAFSTGVSPAGGKEVRTPLLCKLKEVFQRLESQPVQRVIKKINLKLRGWANYFRSGTRAGVFST